MFSRFDVIPACDGHTHSSDKLPVSKHFALIDLGLGLGVVGLGLGLGLVGLGLGLGLIGLGLELGLGLVLSRPVGLGLGLVGMENFLGA